MDQLAATIGCVSYLNARPLIAGVEASPGVRVVSDVPSRLLDGLVSGRFDVALCPVIDYQTAATDLAIVPVGAIGSDGETLTVRVFSSRPLSRVTRIAVDGDSRTSVALLQLVFAELYGDLPRLDPLPAGPGPRPLPPEADAILLIGDKVITGAPALPYQLDLGEAWKRLTGLPFVFATWMARASDDLGGLPELLRHCREANAHRIDDIVAGHAAAAGWPEDLARHYLGTILRYRLGQRELKAITTFWSRCRDAGLIAELRPLRLHRSEAEPEPRSTQRSGLTTSGAPIGPG